MSARKLSAAETEALLTNLVDRSNCPNGCECVFCRTFDEGFKAGLDDAKTTFIRALEELQRKVRA